MCYPSSGQAFCAATSSSSGRWCPPVLAQGGGRARRGVVVGTEPSRLSKVPRVRHIKVHIFGVVGQMKENSSGPGVWLTGTRHLHRPRPLQHHEAWSRPSEARGLQPGRAQDGVEGQREQLRAGSTRPGWEPRASIPPAAREYRGLPRLGAPRFLVHGPYPPPKPAELSGEQAQTP